MIKRVPVEPWSTWEKLCLANAVIKAGDQNWNAVSRTVKIIYEDSMQILGHEMRPPHWFSVKQCAAQYELLIARVVPKRKKRDRNSESADPVHRDAIFNTLKNEYIEELEKKKEDDRLEYAKILKRRDDILAGVYDDVLDEMWAEELKEKDKDIKLKLKYKLGEKNAERNLSPIKTFTPLPEPGSGPIVSTPPPTSSTSPLLTSLLQSPSQHTLPSSPSISLLLNSTPSIPTNESPTLTKLLESPSSKVPGTAQEIRPRPSDLPRHQVLLSPPRPILPAPLPVSREMEVLSEPVPEVQKEPLKVIEHAKIVDNSKKPVKEVVNSEIVIEEEEEEEEEERPAKKIKLAYQQSDLAFEVNENEPVDVYVDKLTDAIVEAVGTNEDSELDSEKDVKAMCVEEEQEEISKSPLARTSEDEKEHTEEIDEVTTGDDTSKDAVEEAAASASSNDIPPAKAAPTDEFNTTDDEPEDHVQIEHNDHEAVEIIMGSNSNSVINVLAQDSSSEDITQSCEESKEHSAPAVTDEESKPEHDDASDQKEYKSEPEDVPVVEIDEDSVSKSPSKKTEEEDDEVEEPTATEDTSSSEAIEPEQGKKESTPPSTPAKDNISSNMSLKEVSVTLEAIDVQQTCRTGEKDIKEETKPALSEKSRRSRKKSSNIDSKPSSPASSFNEDEKEYRAWKKSVLLVYSRIASHKYASVFSKPITDAAGYGNWILEPMDLSTIKKNIESGSIRTTMEFQRDVLLMIQNAVIYNAENSLIHNMAKEMWSDVINEMNVMVQALGDGVPLGGSVEGETAPPTRSGRQAKLSVEKKATPGAPKRQSRNRL